MTKIKTLVAAPEVPSVSFTVNDAASATLVSITGCGDGEHAGYVRVAGADGPDDYKQDLRWIGDGVHHTFRFVVTGGLAVIDGGPELRFGDQE